MYGWNAIVTMEMRPFLAIPEEEIWRKPTEYVIMMYGMYLKDMDAREAEAKKRHQDLLKNQGKTVK